MQRLDPEVISQVLYELGSSSNMSFSLEAVSVIVDAKRQRRLAKTLPFDCFVFDTNDNPDELAVFLQKLQKVKHNIPDHTRFQILYLHGIHWAAADVQIDKGKIDFILFESIQTLQHILPVMSTIHKNCPGAVVNFCRVSLQVDGHNCATFALDTAFRAAKIKDLHAKIQPFLIIQQGNNFVDIVMEQLDELAGLYKGLNRNEMLEAAADVKEVCLHPQTMPKEFGPLFRNTQNISICDAYFRHGLFGNDKKPLDTYVMERTINANKIPNVPALLKNDSIARKREKIKKRSLLFAQQDCSGLEDRQGTQFLSQYDNESMVEGTGAAPMEKDHPNEPLSPSQGYC